MNSVITLGFTVLKQLVTIPKVSLRISHLLIFFFIALKWQISFFFFIFLTDLHLHRGLSPLSEMSLLPCLGVLARHEH